jgi:hypothetical protein
MHAGTIDPELYPYAGEKPKSKARRTGDELLRGAAS